MNLADGSVAGLFRGHPCIAAILNRRGIAMTTAAEIKHFEENGLYSGANEHDACGVGFVAHIKGHKSHAIVQQGLKILENLDHRGAVGADKLMGDGAGILIQMPGRALPRGNGRAGRAAAATRRIRRRHGLPAQGARFAPGLRTGPRARRQGRRPGAAGLARRAGGPRHAHVAHRARKEPDPAPDLHRPRPRRDRARTRWNASST